MTTYLFSTHVLHRKLKFSFNNAFFIFIYILNISIFHAFCNKYLTTCVNHKMHTAYTHAQKFTIVLSYSILSMHITYNKYFTGNPPTAVITKLYLLLMITLINTMDQRNIFCSICKIQHLFSSRKRQIILIYLYTYILYIFIYLTMCVNLKVHAAYIHTLLFLTDILYTTYLQCKQLTINILHASQYLQQ